MLPTRPGLATIAFALVAGGCGLGGGSRAPVQPPLIEVSLIFDRPLPEVLRTGDVYDAKVRVSNPDLHAVTVRLLNPPPGCSFEAGRAVPHGDERRLRWVVPAEALGAHRLEFFAGGHVEAGPNPSDALHRTRRLALNTRVDVGTRLPPADAPVRTVQVADVGGSTTGRLSTLALVRFADVGTTVDAGAVLVWPGTPLPGGPAPTELRAPDPQPGDRLGDGVGATMQLADVTGDGVLDVVVAAPHRRVGGVSEAGSVFVWRGLGFGATPLPLMEIRRAEPRVGDGEGLYFKTMDCTGDGVLDVVVHMPNADTTSADVGVVMVVAGGAGLGTTAPVELGHFSSTQAGLGLGRMEDGGLRVADVTGDGGPELLLAAPEARLLGGVAGAGCVLVWRHVGPAHVASFSANARRLVSAEIAEGMGLAKGGGFEIGDVTGDGIADVVAVASRFPSPGAEMGQGSVWSGGAALFDDAGLLAATATLRPANVLFHGHLGEGPRALQLGDVTGDGVLDVIAAAPLENGAQGAIYLWAGGVGLTAGPVLPSVRLAVPTGLPGDGLAGGLGLPTPAFHLADLTGDGVLDVLAAAPHTRVSRFGDVGAIHLWAGGTPLDAAPRATLTLAAPSGGAQLGAARSADGASGVQLCDVTGDGLVDVLGLAAGATHESIGGAGAIAFWKGGATLTGDRTEDALFVDPAPLVDGNLGAHGADQPLFVHLTGDRAPELVASARTAGAGRLLVWSPGKAPSGVVLPVVSADTGPTARLAHLLAGDWDGDGRADLAFVETSLLATPAHSAVRALRGATPLGGLVDVVVPFASAGGVAAPPIVAGDVTGDRLPELFVGCPADEVDGEAGAGTLRVFDLAGGAFATYRAATMRRQLPRADDHLGD